MKQGSKINEEFLTQFIEFAATAFMQNHTSQNRISGNRVIVNTRFSPSFNWQSSLEPLRKGEVVLFELDENRLGDQNSNDPEELKRKIVAILTEAVDEDFTKILEDSIKHSNTLADLW